MELSRRDLLKIGAFGSAALALPLERVARTQLAIDNRIAASQLPAPFTVPFATPPVLQPAFEDAGTAYYDITQQQVRAEILPGLQTTIWGYNGITPGPTIVNKQGQQAVVRQTNNLPGVHPQLRYNVWTSTHLHGSCSLPQYDGYASDITNPGQYKDYHYPNIQDARTLWYHDHGVHITAFNAYMGLAAQYILHDPNELSLPIPHGPYDVPLILKDAMFQSNGELIIDDQGEDSLFGDVILVNGRPWPLMQVEPRKYRFRVLNASVSRSYDLALSTGEGMTVIATDGGLMPHPQTVGNFRIGMAERYEVVIDFAKYAPGTRVVLQNRQPDNNQEFETTGVVMAFQVGNTVSSSANNHVPQDLNPNMAVMGLQESDAARTRHFRFERSSGHWTINGTTWEDVVNSDYEFVLANPGANDVEIWELENSSGGWFHPVHIHLVDFKILDRNGQPPLPHEQGPKDVAYVGENETVRVIMRFEHQVGKYMMHCHNLVHEDHDMMGQFSVGEDGGRNHPIKADPCKNLPAGALFTRPRPRDDDDDNSGPGNGGDRDRGSDAVAAPAERPPAIRANSIRRASTRKKRRKLIKCKPPKRRTRVTKKVKIEAKGRKTRTVKRKVITCRAPKKRRSAVRRPKKRT